jgi:ATP-dependent exoDNAse (exonuclease V) beta subunit
MEAPPIGFIAGDTVGDTAEQVADEIVRLLADGVVRDKATGIRRPVQPADVAILFRSRDSHREFEHALERRGVSTYVYKGLGFFEADEVQDVVAVLRFLADPQSNLRAAAFLRSRVVRLSDAAVVRLAPDLAAALTAPAAPQAMADLGDDDRRVLTHVRGAVPRWLSWVDRLTPTELLDAVLTETAYAYETRGAGRPQARENLKKLRAMVARFQNRGYATLSRVADHLDELAVGDESNAAIDAVDAVSLMTVHAAKGLEFPVVFVVNMNRGTGGFRAPIRVASAPDGEASVSIADYQSEADEDTQAREREESKRLLYVALTRARDRLYLSAVARGGVCRMGRGSLGEVMPPSLVALLGVSAGGAADRVVTWQAGDVEHRVLVPGRPPVPRHASPPRTDPAIVDDFGLVLDE